MKDLHVMVRLMECAYPAAEGDIKFTGWRIGQLCILMCQCVSIHQACHTMLVCVSVFKIRLGFLLVRAGEIRPT